MTGGWSKRAATALALACVLALFGAVASAAADVSVSYQPDTLCVHSLQQFTTVLTIDREGSGFNGYEAVVRFDPAKLSVVAVREVPASQGGLMKGMCGNTWWRTRIEEGSIFLSHVTLCGPDSIVGPGPLSSITWQALADASVAEVWFEYIEFYYAGRTIPSVSHDATVITTPVCPATGSCCLLDSSCQVLVPEECDAFGGVFLHFLEGCTPDPCAAMAGNEVGGRIPELRIAPNPSVNIFEFSYVGEESGPVVIEIFDSLGRAVFRGTNSVGEGAASSALGSREAGSIIWHPADRSGRRLSPGAYFARISVQGRSFTRRLILAQ
ncbi:MAG: T9SS type A sorting domain-containing protein [Candidatus Eisenbacteria bacterium]|nr:T9SS type A sorting domain-containing protein [Candidatus Eisenbacteria bacterium]